MSSLIISPSVSRFAQPLSELYRSYPNKRLVVGVGIVSASGDGQKRLLLLQRSASEEDYPLMYEIPGGHTEDDKDGTILQTVTRETLEETGLVVREIVENFEGFEYETKKGLTVQLNFLVEVEGGKEPPKVMLNPEEHQAFAWVGQGDKLEDFPMTPSMSEVVRTALKVIYGNSAT